MMHPLLVASPAVVVLACVCVSAITDVRTGYIFDVVTGSAAALLLIVDCCTGRIESSVLGACAAGGLLFTLHLMTRGRGMGLGDVKLAAVIGAGLGPIPALEAIGAAFVLGALAAVYGLLRRTLKRSDAIPFGPYLAAGTIASVIAGGVLQ